MSHPKNIISVWPADGGAEPDLLVGGLLVDDVGDALLELDGEHAVGQRGVGPGQRGPVVVDQLAEPVLETLERLLRQLEVGVGVHARVEAAAVEALAAAQLSAEQPRDQHAPVLCVLQSARI